MSLSFLKTAALTVSAAFILPACGAANSAESPDTFDGGLAPLSGDYIWDVDMSQSSVSFQADYNGSFEAGFTRFDTVIKLNPENPSEGEIHAAVDLSSLRTDQDDVRSNLPTAGWFDSKTHPIATFTSRDISGLGGDNYAAKGQMRLKGISKPATLTFSLNVTGDRAIADGGFSVNRMDYNVGSGSDFKDESWVKFPVNISVHIEAER